MPPDILTTLNPAPGRTPARQPSDGLVPRPVLLPEDQTEPPEDSVHLGADALDHSGHDMPFHEVMARAVRQNTGSEIPTLRKSANQNADNPTVGSPPEVSTNDGSAPLNDLLVLLGASTAATNASHPNGQGALPTWLAETLTNNPAANSITPRQPHAALAGAVPQSNPDRPLSAGSPNSIGINAQSDLHSTQPKSGVLSAGQQTSPDPQRAGLEDSLSQRAAEQLKEGIPPVAAAALKASRTPPDAQIQVTPSDANAATTRSVDNIAFPLSMTRATPQASPRDALLRLETDTGALPAMAASVPQPQRLPMAKTARADFGQLGPNGAGIDINRSRSAQLSAVGPGKESDVSLAADTTAIAAKLQTKDIMDAPSATRSAPMDQGRQVFSAAGSGSEIHTLHAADLTLGDVPTAAMAPLWGRESAAADTPVPLAQLRDGVTTRVVTLAQMTEVNVTTARTGTGELTTEMELAPAGLGNVRLTLQTSERGLQLTVIVERPESLETVRRHLDGLHRSLLTDGVTLDSVNVETGRRDSAGGQAQPELSRWTEPAEEPLLPDPATTSPRGQVPPVGRLDISL